MGGTGFGPYAEPIRHPVVILMKYSSGMVQNKGKHENSWVSPGRLESRFLWGYTARLEMFFRRIALSEKIDLSNSVLDEGEEFMSANQRAYFRAKLNAWKNDILREARETLGHLAEESANHPDLADRASSETDRAIELRARDRQRKLISKIDAALQRLDEGTYGYCEETGEPIGLKRLDARPIATLSIEAQERHERREKVYRDE